ncbi:HNH endonuclease [Enterobacter huaxiensis]|uniref:HNH endonuclease n=2 Tax=Enterobacter TaxID=547 RepID=A0A428LY71_9ENTR|nr:HNH endonuclease [Enterobacter huaxiensis]RSK70341.1 HNH endonuclease [Enterobacter huaxiensis]
MLSACVEHKQNRKYGITTTKVNGKTVSIKLHKKAYCEANGLTLDDIRGLIVMHECDNPKCINPSHLRIGTHQDNMSDMALKGRSCHRHGELNPRAKLSSSDVDEIKRLKGKKTQKQIADMFNVSKSHIGRIQRGDRWGG